MNARKLFKGIKYASIGVATQVVAAIDRDLGRKYLVRELNQLPGVSGKLGQMLALKFGKTEWQEFAPSPVPVPWVKARIDKEIPKLSGLIDGWHHWDKFTMRA
jgi:hypothetical protein